MPIGHADAAFGVSPPTQRCGDMELGGSAIGEGQALALPVGSDAAPAKIHDEHAEKVMSMR